MNHDRIAQNNTASMSSATLTNGFLQRKCACGHHTPGGGSCARCSGKLKRLPLQNKLTINEPGDQYEQEADRVANQVMRMPAPKVHAQIGKNKNPSSNPIVQRRNSGNGEGTANVPSIVHDVLRSPGQPLDRGTRDFMEPRFGQDFSNVRVHTDSRAAESAQSVNAHAYTVGSNVVFGGGRYSPQANSGQRLLAHELTHVVQQNPLSQKRTGGELRVSAIPNPQLNTQPSQLMRAPAGRTGDAQFPTETERGDVIEILNPQQEEASQSNEKVDPVTDPDGFRRDMKQQMNDYINRVLPSAQARQASQAKLGRDEVLSLGDIVQPEVEKFYGSYLKVASHSKKEAQARANFQLRSNVDLVSNFPVAEINHVACQWVVSRMFRGVEIINNYNVLASGVTAKGNCSSGAPPKASKLASERDQALFERVRDEVFSARQADLKTIIQFQSSFAREQEIHIQTHIRPESGENAQETKRRGRWETLGTLIHEMHHAVAHEKFNRATNGIERSKLAREGFAEYFARPVYDAIRKRAFDNNGNALRASIEGVQASPRRGLAQDRKGYQSLVDKVIEIREILGGNEENLRVAFFMGQVEYIGLGGWNSVEAKRREALRSPANQLGIAAVLIPDGTGFFRVDYGRVLYGRGGSFQTTLGGTINYLTDGNRLGIGGTLGLQYSWPHFFVRSRLGVGASLSPGQPFEESIRLDLIPNVEAGVRIGVARIGPGMTMLIPIAGGPIDDKVFKIGVKVGLSIDF